MKRPVGIKTRTNNRNAKYTAMKLTILICAYSVSHIAHCFKGLSPEVRFGYLLFHNSQVSRLLEKNPGVPVSPLSFRHINEELMAFHRLDPHVKLLH